MSKGGVELHVRPSVSAKTIRLSEEKPTRHIYPLNQKTQNKNNSINKWTLICRIKET